MNKKKRKQASASKELSSTLMQMANWLRYKKGWLPDAATRQAWLCQHALEALGEGVVQLQYLKKDGSKRIACVRVFLKLTTAMSTRAAVV